MTGWKSKDPPASLCSSTTTTLSLCFTDQMSMSWGELESELHAQGLGWGPHPLHHIQREEAAGEMEGGAQDA